MRIFNPGPCSCQYGLWVCRHPIPSYLRLGVTTMKKKKREESVTPNGQPPVQLLPTAETETDTDIERPKVRPAGVRGHLSAGRRGRVAGRTCVAAGVLRVPRRRRRRGGESAIILLFASGHTDILAYHQLGSLSKKQHTLAASREENGGKNIARKKKEKEKRLGYPHPHPHCTPNDDSDRTNKPKIDSEHPEAWLARWLPVTTPRHASLSVARTGHGILYQSNASDPESESTSPASSTHTIDIARNRSRSL